MVPVIAPGGGRGGELLRGDCAGGVGCAGADNVDAEGVHLAAVDLSEADFQHDLLAVRRHVDEEGVDDLLGIILRHLVDIVGDVFVGDGAGDNDLAFFGAGLDGLIRVGLLQGIAEAGDVDIGRDLQHPGAAFLIPEDDVTGACALGGNHNLIR